MADGVFNIAKGRGVEFCWRVDNNDPTNSALVVVALKASGLEADGTLQDYDTLAAILAASNDEATNEGYERLFITDTGLTFGSPDDTNNRFDVDIPDPVWTAVKKLESGNEWGKLLYCYDSDTGSGTDSTIVPISHHDFPMVPDGSKLTGEVNVAGFLRAA